MASHLTSIDSWAASVRKRMANDPGRQDLDDHILCNGFLFLDEYLEDILLGARTEPIIELTKTPGRRKDVSKKDRAATTANVKMFSFQSLEKENMPAFQPPLQAKKDPTSFQKAILKVTRENQPSTDTVFPAQLHSLSTMDENPIGDIFVSALDPQQDAQDKEAAEVPATPRSAHITVASVEISPSLPSAPAAVYSKYLAAEATAVSDKPDDNAGVDLSVIVEGDENGMSRASVSPFRRPGPIIRDKEISYRIPTDPSNPDGPMATVTVSYNPNADDDDDTQAFPTAFDHSYHDSEPTSTASSFPIDPYARDYETHELPQVIPDNHTQSPNLNAPPPSPPGSSITRKASVPVFPSLPGPSPRRANHDPLMTGSVIGSTRPNVAVGHGANTRSSWLHKARDVTAKRTSVVAGVKRKSGDLFEEVDSTMPLDGYGRTTKVAKTSLEDGVSDALTEEKPLGKLSIQPFKPVLPSKIKGQLTAPVVVGTVPQIINSEGMMDTLKRTVEGLGARTGKGLGKSLGGAAAAAAAAEAKAAAEARLAQREVKGVDGARYNRLSVSDLVGAYEGGGLGKGKEKESLDMNIKLLPSPPAPHLFSEQRASISTTPSNSPAPGLLEPPSGPNIHTIPKFTVQRAINPEPSYNAPDSQPSTQSTYVSSIFDDHSSWQQSSFVTEYTASQGFCHPEASQHNFALVHGDKGADLSQEVGWTQNPTKHIGLHKESPNLVTRDERAASSICPLNPMDNDQLPSLFRSELQDEDIEEGEIDFEHDGTEHTDLKVTTSSDDLKLKDRSSQDITASTQNGLVAQASSFFSKVIGSSVTSALGGSKRGKAEPVKSIQLAAAVAKKQQEEADRKAARLKEMDKRRAAIASKKADQGNIDKVKQQGDRNKRERDEGTDRPATKTVVRKVEEEVTKKRKVVVEIEKKSVNKKPISKDKKDITASRIGKPVIIAPASHLYMPSSSLSKSFKHPGIPASSSQPSVKLVGTSQTESKATSALPRSGEAKDISEGVLQPAQALHAQMHARVQAQILQARQDEPLIPSESIELPDINSEYSNSDDEDRPRTFDPPDWAQSPVLSQALQSQSRLNPDDIFGPVRPLRMEEIFTTRHSRFRARTSSANWAGTDELTTEEERNYAKRMGYLD